MKTTNIANMRRNDRVRESDRVSSRQRLCIYFREDNNSYFLHYSKLNGEHIEKGYQVHFVPFQNDRSDYNASKVTVINAPERVVKQTTAAKKKKDYKRHKSCNADKVIVNDKKFQRFAKNFMNEQKALSKERSNNGKTY